MPRKEICLEPKPREIEQVKQERFPGPRKYSLYADQYPTLPEWHRNETTYYSIESLCMQFSRQLESVTQGDNSIGYVWY